MLIRVSNTIPYLAFNPKFFLAISDMISSLDYMNNAKNKSLIKLSTRHLGHAHSITISNFCKSFPRNITTGYLKNVYSVLTTHTNYVSSAGVTFK